ncbi:hypothetical protein C4J81_17535 [Deltaproteobacteria bacterium Smac51]|nr:hypothetical protein C4J81_17535 [Deltaproteobacteria bacterium Smac51]
MTEGAKQTVLLLHAAVVGAWSLNLLGRRLEREGFKVINHDYPNRKLTIFEAAEDILPLWKKVADENPGPVHIAGHSMGGLVARRLLNLHQPPNFSRLITMGTPHKGSPLADSLHNWIFYQWLFGPAGQDLITARPIDWPGPWPPAYEIGLVAGSVPVGPGTLTLRGRSDGTVLAESSQPSGGTDYVTVPATHTSIPYLKITAKLAANFFRTGRFKI